MSEPMQNPWEDITEDWNRKDDGERYIRRIDERHWISVLYRLTGFGHHEWETAICIVPEIIPEDWPKWKRSECLIIGGDRRDELATMPAEELRGWYDANIDGNRNSVETILEAIRP